MGLFDQLFGPWRKRKQEEAKKRQKKEPKKDLGPGRRGTPPPGQPERLIPSDEVEAFVFEQMPLFVNSSNVVMAQYHHEVKKMMIEFGGSAAYLYSNVSEQEAIDFARSPSKGKWVWSNLRVRGSKSASRKPFVRIS